MKFEHTNRYVREWKLWGGGELRVHWSQGEIKADSKTTGPWGVFCFV